MKIGKEKELRVYLSLLIQENYGSFLADEKKLFFFFNRRTAVNHAENMTKVEKPPFYRFPLNNTIK